MSTATLSRPADVTDAANAANLSVLAGVGNPAAASTARSDAAAKAAKIKSDAAAKAAKVKADATKAAKAAKDTPDMTVYNDAVKMCRTAAKQLNNANWIIGDAAGTVETAYGKGTVQKFADAIAVAYKTVLDLRKVAEVYAPADRSDTNSWTVHQIFGRLDDRNKLVKAQKWSTAEARALVNSRKVTEPENAPVGDGESAPAELSNAEKADKVRARIARLEAELIEARAELEALEADAPAAPTMHSPAGMPQHAVGDPQAACPECRRNGMAPTAAPRDARKPALAVA